VDVPDRDALDFPGPGTYERELPVVPRQDFSKMGASSSFLTAEPAATPLVDPSSLDFLPMERTNRYEEHNAVESKVGFTWSTRPPPRVLPPDIRTTEATPTTGKFNFYRVHRPWSRSRRTQNRGTVAVAFRADKTNHRGRHGGGGDEDDDDKISDRTWTPSSRTQRCAEAVDPFVREKDRRPPNFGFSPQRFPDGPPDQRHLGMPLDIADLYSPWTKDEDDENVIFKSTRGRGVSWTWGAAVTKKTGGGH